MTQNSSSSKLWGGCFTKDSDKFLVQLNNSLNVDKRLFNEDIDGSKAYAEILFDTKLITSGELLKIKTGLEHVRCEWLNGTFDIRESDEDIHTANERRLSELIGSDIGGKLHTGRSRNDQVAVDMKLWILKAIEKVRKDLLTLIETMIIIAEKYMHVLMPGYTHLQRAQAVRLSHWILSYAFSVKDDCDRLKDLYKRSDSMPLGSGAIAGNPFGIDREKLASRLAFTSVTSNSMQAVSDRDFIVEFNFVASLISMHMSRFAEDLILYSSKEFGFLKLSEEFSTGSSLMPQKRNPDSLELVRGISGGIFGQLAGFMMTMKGLPSTYNKDMQNDKQSMFYVYDQLELALGVIVGVLRTIHVNEEKCRAALSCDMLATDLAYYLVRKGVPFRKAHHVSGEIVAFADKQNTSIEKVSLKDLKTICPVFDETVEDIWNFENSVEQYSVIGGTSRSAIQRQIKELNAFLKL